MYRYAATIREMESLPRSKLHDAREKEPDLSLADTLSTVTSPAGHPASRTLLLLLFSATLVLCSFVWQGGYGFNIGDEGYLWYGVQRVRIGEVPLLDFMSYDPGRYYWSAALMGLLHDDRIMALRGTAAVFELLGLFFGLRLLWQGKSAFDAVLLTSAAITLLAWMFTWYKAYDSSVSILLAGALALLVQQPSRRRFFLAGVTVGLAAVFGRNHGIYGLAGLLGAVIYLAFQQRTIGGLASSFWLCACGVTVGYLPVLIMLVAVPGFAVAFWESIRSMFEFGATNLPLPVPWPWQVPVARLPLSTAAVEVLTGTFFIAIAAFGVLGPLWIVRRALQQRHVAPQFVAAAVLAPPYAHYAYSRADLFHLSMGIFPFLIGLFLILAQLPRRARWVLALVTTAASLIAVLPQHPGWSCRVIEPCVAMEVGGNMLTIEPQIAGFVTMLENVTAQYASNGQNLLITPLWPGAYALLKRKSPMWEIYALLPRGSSFERQEIERIKAARPALALVLDVAVDGRDDLRFRNTHPLIDKYIADSFDPVAVQNFGAPIFHFYKSR